MANTGSKAYLRLEQYNTGDGLATGLYKDNDSGDPDYVAPVSDTGTCPLPAAADTTNPTFPTSLTAPSRSTDWIGLNWVASDNVEVVKQRLYWKTAASGTYNTIYLSKSTGSYTKTGLAEGTSHNFYIKAWDRYGNTTNSNVLTHSTTSSDTTAPIFTTQPIAGAITETSFQVNWQSSDAVGVTSQIFYWKQSISPTWSTVNLSGSATTYTKTGLTEGTAYQFYIVAYDAAGNFRQSTTLNGNTTSATQVSVSPTYRFSPTNGETFTLNIYDATGSWSGSSTAFWAATSPSSGSGSSTSVVVDRNWDPEMRAAIITISNNGNNAVCEVDQDTGGGCLIHGSKITMQDGSIRNIEDLVVGDTLMGVNIDNFEDTNDIEKLRSQKLNNMSFQQGASIISNIEVLKKPRVISLNDGLFTATPHHTHIYKQNGKWVFMPLGMIEEGDSIMDMDGNEIVVYKRGIVNEEHTVYKLTLESPNHTFIGNNILTHNIK